MSDDAGKLIGIEKLYSENLEKFGVVSRAVGWPNQQDHSLRFDKLATVIDVTRDSVSINDLGCGYGSLYSYLKEKGVRVHAYRGHDISPKMIEAAQKIVNSSTASFSLSPLLDQTADYSFASGIFNVRFECDEVEWESYVIKTLQNINIHSSRGFAFNLLTSYVDWKDEHLYYADPCFYFKYCKLNFSSKVALYHDTHLYEWTIVVKK